MPKLLVFLSLVVSILLAGGCKPESPPESSVETEQTSVSKGKAVAATVVTEWREKRKNLSGNPKTVHSKASGILYRIIKALPRDRQDKLSTYLTSRKPDEMSTSDREMATDWEMTTALIRVFIMTDDKERLVRLLSRKCLRTMGPDPIEFDFALHAEVRDDGLQDPVSVLAESYKKATNDEAKNTLRDIFGCAFPSLRKKITDDAQFVDACTQWYQENRSRLTLNMNYLDNFEAGAFRLGPSPGLFLFKEQKEKGQ